MNAPTFHPGHTTESLSEMARDLCADIQAALALGESGPAVQELIDYAARAAKGAAEIGKGGELNG